MPNAIADPAPEISIVIPAFNEARNLAELTRRVAAALDSRAISFETIFVDDGSQDDTMETLRALRAEEPRLFALSLSRNFGKEVAIAAGLDHARGRAVVIMDADLQHPPEVIPLFVEKWREGYKNVFGQRKDRSGEARMRAAMTGVFYRLINRLGDVTLPPEGGDFRLLDYRAVEALRRMPERARFTKGLYAWIGFKTVGVPFDIAGRASGASKFDYRKLARFAVDGLLSFSAFPLKLWTWMGLAISGFALAMAAYFFIRTLLFGVDVPGYPSLIVSIAFFAGVQLISLGVLGEYVARIFNEVKGRPLYLVAERVGFEDAETRRP